MAYRTLRKQLNEGVNYNFSFKSKKSFSDLALTYYAKNKDTGSITQVGSDTGLDADTLTTKTLSLKTLPAGTYYLEVWADLDGANQELAFPDEGIRFEFEITDRFKITN